ncbi:late competence development ComFB family protein [Thermohalobacter berrensis]|uniref:Competence protein ComFB n=1 Tax=Thermohalobacter berrensis TaxID=99594 RepID=A0A419TAU9_9FIRM|nr:late competence development ComFB family protein [Thermohalobacter berrensis]RKD34582.1 competence protein ComFB [Thermohalobacter berrensis]
MKLHNYMEIVVHKKVEEIIEKQEGICKCEKCKLDVTAIALNNLPPKYVVTYKGEVYAKINELKNQFETDIIREIVKAIKIVADNPRHNDE